MPNLLIVEDDEVIAAQIAEQLGAFGYESQIIDNGRDVFWSVVNGAYDAVILDRMLPRLDGVSVLQGLRDNNINLPVVMLTALGKTERKIEGLDAGADDYIVKPVDPAELDARIRALIRARRRGAEASEETIRAGDILVSPARFCAWRDGHLLDLQSMEFRLLAFLVRNTETTVTRKMVIEGVWGYDFDPKTNLVEAYIRRLRLKLTQFGGDDPIRTVRGVGYVLKS